MNVLLIEDDDADATLFQRTLSNCNGEHHVFVCDSMERGLRWLKDNPCDVVLLDLSLPDCYGLDGIQEIHGRFADLPIVMLTGFDDDETALIALEEGAQDYLIKGKATSQELERTLRHAIQRQQIINENRRLVSELKIAARSDALTGVLNRHAMIEEFQQHWSHTAAHGLPLSCVIMDIDFFKRINDSFGHLAGDEVLRTIARVISENARPGDCIARYGGEEFCVILAGASLDEAIAWSEQTRIKLSASQIEVHGMTMTVTASFGVAQRTGHIQSIEELIDVADQALLIAKNSGRDLVFGFGSTNESLPTQRMSKPPVETVGDTEPSVSTI